MSDGFDIDKRVAENPSLSKVLGWMLYIGILSFYSGIAWAFIRSADYHYLGWIIVGGVWTVITALWTYYAYGSTMIWREKE